MTRKATFDFHVDAKHFNFMLMGPMYIRVRYVAAKNDDKLTVSIGNISAAPYLINAIVLRNNWLAVDTEIAQAAQDHAEKAFAGKGKTRAKAQQIV
jgi:hypothetical protein